MQIYTMPNGGVVTIDSDNLQDKIDMLEKLGVTYTPSVAEIAAEARGNSARVNAKAIPEWASWSEAQALVWIQTNVGTPLTSGRSSLPATLTLATTRASFVVLLNIMDKMLVVLISLARMVVALRNAQWKDLQDK